MDVLQALRTRRSIKQRTDRLVARDEIERLLEAATLGPDLTTRLP